MPIYLWNGKNRAGEKKKGELEAASPEAAALHLKNMGMIPDKVKEKPKDISEIIPALAPKVKINDLVVFTRQFAVMVDAGLPLVQFGLDEILRGALKQIGFKSFPQLVGERGLLLGVVQLPTLIVLAPAIVVGCWVTALSVREPPPPPRVDPPAAPAPGPPGSRSDSPAPPSA